MPLNSSQTFRFSATKVLPSGTVKQKQLDEFLDENLKSRAYTVQIAHGLPIFFINKRMEASASSKTTISSITDHKECLPLPLIPDMLNMVSRAKVKYFTKLDI